MIVTKSFDDSLFKVVPIEPSDIMKGASDFDVGMPGYDGSQYAITTEECDKVYRDMLAAVGDDLPGVVTHSGDPVADHDQLAIIAATIESAAKKCIDVAGGDSGVVDNASHGWGCGDCAKAIAALDPSTILAGIK